MVGLVNAIGITISIVTIKYFGRRTILIFGHIGIFIAYGFVIFFDKKKESTGVIISILTFLFIYQNSSGPVTWIYFTETTVDAALGICLFTLWFTVFLLSFICPILMGLNVDDVFMGFSVVSLIGALFCFIWIKETRGLTEK